MVLLSIGFGVLTAAVEHPLMAGVVFGLCALGSSRR